MQNYCSQCAAPVKSGAKFCSRCGASLAASGPARCPNPACGAELDGTEVFCAHCGQRIGEGRRADTSGEEAEQGVKSSEPQPDALDEIDRMFGPADKALEALQRAYEALDQAGGANPGAKAAAELVFRGLVASLVEDNTLELNVHPSDIMNKIKLGKLVSLLTNGGYLKG